MNLRTTLQRVLLVTGVLLCLVYAGSLVYSYLGSRAALRSFEAAQTAPAAESKPPAPPLEMPTSPVDYALWSQKRIAGYMDSLAAQFSPPLAVLRVPKLKIEVPVLEGTDELVLNRGVGRIPGTSLIGQGGNIGIAGHRDGFFRGLKDIDLGDSLILTTPEETATYVVDKITIVHKTDASVLGQTQAPYITLVTCYPFYFVGHAPQRYIVRCALRERLKNSDLAGSPGRKPSPSGG